MAEQKCPSCNSSNIGRIPLLELGTRHGVRGSTTSLLTNVAAVAGHYMFSSWRKCKACGREWKLSN